ncbi:MAG: hypothetical protein AABN95_02190 [Acidobacteriota bacterium]
MKKLTATVICLIVLSMGAMPLAAQTRSRRSHSTNYSARYDGRYNRDVRRDGRYARQASRGRYDNNVYRNGDVYRNSDVYSNDGYIYGDNRSVWDKSRDKITTAGGALGGAALGGLIGGKKGAIIGAITGGAGAAIYTYKIRDKNRQY